MVDQRGGHGHALAHAFGIFADDLAVGLELKEVEQAFGALDGGRTREAVHAADELQEFGAAEAVEQQRLVGNQADAPLDGQFFGRHAIAENFDGAAVGRNESGEHPDGGRFARAIRTEEAEEGTAGDLQCDAVHGRFEPIGLSEVADQDRRRGHIRSVRCRRSRAGFARAPVLLAAAFADGCDLFRGDVQELQKLLVLLRG